jgi:uncharacterized repeat protein (TIGR04076 family)
MESKIYKIKIKVNEIRGTGKCPAGLKVGDTFEINENGQPVPINFCGWAFVVLWPFITPLRYGGSLPWEKDPKKTFVSCPDPDNTVVFEITKEDDNFDKDKPLPAF